MNTSANVSEYSIYKNNKCVGNFSQNNLCENRYHKLLKYQPLNEHTIMEFIYVEDNYNDCIEEDEPINLEDFLKKNILFNKVIKEYFKSKI